MRLATVFMLPKPRPCQHERSRSRTKAILCREHITLQEAPPLIHVYNLTIYRYILPSFVNTPSLTSGSARFSTGSPQIHHNTVRITPPSLIPEEINQQPSDTWTPQESRQQHSFWPSHEKLINPKRRWSRPKIKYQEATLTGYMIFRIHPRRKKSKFRRSGVPVSRGITCALELELHRRFSPKVAIFLAGRLKSATSALRVRLSDEFMTLSTYVPASSWLWSSRTYLSLSLSLWQKTFWANWILVHRRLFEGVVAAHDH